MKISIQTRIFVSGISESRLLMGKFIEEYYL